MRDVGSSSETSEVNRMSADISKALPTSTTPHAADLERGLGASFTSSVRCDRVIPSVPYLYSVPPETGDLVVHNFPTILPHQGFEFGGTVAAVVVPNGSTTYDGSVMALQNNSAASFTSVPLQPLRVDDQKASSTALANGGGDKQPASDDDPTADHEHLVPGTETANPASSPSPNRSRLEVAAPNNDSSFFAFGPCTSSANCVLLLSNTPAPIQGGAGSGGGAGVKNVSNGIYIPCGAVGGVGEYREVPLSAMDMVMYSDDGERCYLHNASGSPDEADGDASGGGDSLGNPPPPAAAADDSVVASACETVALNTAPVAVVTCVAIPATAGTTTAVVSAVSYPVVAVQGMTSDVDSGVVTPVVCSSSFSVSPSPTATVLTGGVCPSFAHCTPNTVYVHVNPGETLSVRVGNEVQHIPGPATVRMVSGQHPPTPLPLNVPPGHIVQQILDETGTLRHLILSPQSPLLSRRPYACVNVQSRALCQSMQLIPLASGQPIGSFCGLSLTSTPPSYYPVMADSFHVGPAAGSVENFTPDDPEASQKHAEDRTVANGNEAALEPGKSLQILQILSKMQSPEVDEIGPRTACVKWRPLDCSDASAASSSPTVQIEEAELSYDLIVFEQKYSDRRVKYYRCRFDQTSQLLADLKPATEYSVRIQANLEERRLHGEPSKPVTFKTSSTIPDKPPAPKLIQRTKNSLLLRWNAPCDNGSKITSFHLESNQGGDGDDFKEIFCENVRQHKVQKLQPSTMYRFRLAVSNLLGKSEYSEAISAQTSGMSPDKPDPPTLVEATYSSLRLSWKKVERADEYQLYMEEPGSGYGFLPLCTTADTGFVVDSLQRFREYRFRLSASNCDGHSYPSEPVVFQTAPMRPQPPPKPYVKGRVSSTTLKVGWDQPGDTGGSHIISYTLQTERSDHSWDTVFNGNSQEYSAVGLRPGHNYKYRVSCTSSGGASEFSEPLVVATLPVVPGSCNAPFVVGKLKANVAHIRWAFPEYSGGAEVTEFELEMLCVDGGASSAEEQPRIVYQGVRNDSTVCSLLPGRSYRFRVRASNRVGSGPWSPPLLCQSASSAPDSPTNLRSSSVQPNSVSILWDVPFSSNGAAVTEYRLYVAKRSTDSQSQTPSKEIAEQAVSPARSNNSSGDRHVQSASLKASSFQQAYVGSNCSFCFVSALPNTEYMFKVEAVNCMGVSPASAVLFCKTPPGPPEAPVGLQAEPMSLSEIALSWETPCDNGLTITSYNVGVREANGTWCARALPATDHQCIIDSLSSETVYEFRMQACNSAGAGPFCFPVRAATYSRPPQPPALELVSSTHNCLKLRWLDPKLAVFNESFTYVVEMENKNGTFSPVYEGASKTCKVLRLNESSSYKFRIRAVSSTGGVGPWSDVFHFRTVKQLPPAIKNLPKVQNITENSVFIEWMPVKINLPAGEKLGYCVQLATSWHNARSPVAEDFRTVYKGSDTRYKICGLNPSTCYRVRIYTVRYCSNAVPATGANNKSDEQADELFSSPMAFNFTTAPLVAVRKIRANTRVSSSQDGNEREVRTGMSDGQWAMIILALFTFVALIIASLIQKYILATNA